MNQHENFKNQLQKLSTVVRLEQRKLILEAINFEGIPNKNLLRQIAEYELNIAAIDNNIAELEEAKP